MPESIILEDGSERSVPTAEELSTLQEAATKKAELEAELVKQREELEKIQKDPVQANFRKTREIIDRLSGKIKELGHDVDADGNIIQKKADVDRDEILSEAEKRTKRVLVDNAVADYLSKFDKDTQEVIKVKFQKLSSGEEVGLDNVRSYLDEATRIAVPERSQINPAYYTNGAPPSWKKEDTVVTEGQREMARALGIDPKELEK